MTDAYTTNGIRYACSRCKQKDAALRAGVEALHSTLQPYILHMATAPSGCFCDACSRARVVTTMRAALGEKT